MSEMTDWVKAKDKHKIEMSEKKINLLVTQNRELSLHTVLLDRLCTLKEDQLESDKKFRDSWRMAKVKDLRLSLWFLGLANVALYLDVIKFDIDGAVITSIISLFN